MSTYNGWSNYATWRVNLELFDSMTVEDMGLTITEDLNDPALSDEKAEVVNALANGLEEMAIETVEMEAEGWALDIAKSFLADVDWVEIAEHLVNDAIAEIA